MSALLVLRRDIFSVISMVNVLAQTLQKTTITVKNITNVEGNFSHFFTICKHYLNKKNIVTCS